VLEYGQRRHGRRVNRLARHGFAAGLKAQKRKAAAAKSELVDRLATTGAKQKDATSASEQMAASHQSRKSEKGQDAPNTPLVKNRPSKRGRA
jgi:hypothetical protein